MKENITERIIRNLGIKYPRAIISTIIVVMSITGIYAISAAIKKPGAEKTVGVKSVQATAKTEADALNVNLENTGKRKNVVTIENDDHVLASAEKMYADIEEDTGILIKDKMDAYGRLETFFGLINEGKLQEAYDMFQKNYKKDFGYENSNLFDIRYKYENGLTFSAACDDSRKLDDRYIFKVYIYNGRYIESGNGNPPHVEKVFTVFENGKLADEGILQSVRCEEQYEFFGKLRVYVRRKILTTRGLLMRVMIKNLSYKEARVEYDKNAFYVIDEENKKTYVHENLNGITLWYSIYPRGFGYFDLIFPYCKNIDAKLKMLEEYITEVVAIP